MRPRCTLWTGVGILLVATAPLAAALDKLPEHSTVVPGPTSGSIQAELQKQAAIDAAIQAAPPAVAVPNPVAVAKPAETTTIGPAVAAPAVTDKSAGLEPIPVQPEGTIPAAQLVPRDRWITIGPAGLNEHERRKLHDRQSSPAPEARP